MTLSLPDHWVDDSGVQIRYRQRRGRAPLPALVAAHELGGSLESWDAVAQALPEDIPFLAYDQRGHGASEKTRNCPGLDAQVEDLRCVLAQAALARPPVFVGLAAGARIGVACELRHPGSFAALVLCAPALACTAAQAAYLSERARLARDEGMRAVLEASLARSYPPAYRDDARYAVYRRRLLANDPWCYADANLAVTQQNLTEHLAAITCPVLVLGGEDDLVRPPGQVRQTAEAFARGTFVALPAGHLMALQAPQVLAHTLDDFLRRVAD